MVMGKRKDSRKVTQLERRVVRAAMPEDSVMVKRSFLEAAKCPNCNGVGWYVVSGPEHLEQEQCEWCHERGAILSLRQGE